MIAQSIIEQVLNRADIVEIISRYVDLKPAGAYYKGCCPFHNERTASFMVSRSRGTWFCYGQCHEGGNVLRFLMRYHSISFPEAVEMLAGMCGIGISKEDRCAPDNQAEYKQMEAMLIVCEQVQRFFASQLLAGTTEAGAARIYAYNRWDETFCKEAGIGYAPADGKDIIKFAEQSGISLGILQDLGFVSVSEKTGKHYSFFRERLTIPIRDRFGRVIGFTCRYLGSIEGMPKYMNSKSSLIYNKANSVFGVDIALRAASKMDKFYLVEGAPDVLRLQFIGCNSAVASLGSSWTEKQLSLLKKYSGNICFIPDADPPKQGEKFGTGINSVIQNGLVALKMGFVVSVKEIPLTECNSKNDPDSYIKNLRQLNEMPEYDFILWYADKLFTTADTPTQKKVTVENVSALLAPIDDELRIKMLIDHLSKEHGQRSLWNQALNIARKRLKENEANKSGNNVNLELLKKYGFQENRNCYFSIGNDGELQQWSNFTMYPLFHIKDAVSPLRLYRLTNDVGQKEIVELKQEDLVSLSRFKQKVEGLGNYVWLTNEEKLTKLKRYLYVTTETAVMISQLGWQKQGFYAFGNGVFTTEWHAVDELGIVRLGDTGNYYLPAFSKLYADDPQFFQFERNFVHYNYNSISLHDYAQQMITVFGDNAKVGLSFLLASLFRDIIVCLTKSFPILNLFGPKGSGKSELGHSLMSFFIIENTPPNIQNSTVPALADAVAQCSNALVHLDEFKNDIDITKREFLKGLWDGTGRNRMNLDRDKKREVTRVSCGVIVSGQEMATADIALFSRFIYLSYSKSEFSREAKQEFEKLRTIRRKGCSHLTLQILKYRKRFESEFAANYLQCLHDLVDHLCDENIEDRILRNWLVPLAAFRTLEPVLSFPFDYKELLSITVKGIRNQNSEVKQNNELADFWKFIEYLLKDGKIYHGSDFHIKHIASLKTVTPRCEFQFQETKPILVLSFNRIARLYQSEPKGAGNIQLPVGSLLYYLEHSNGYFGRRNQKFLLVNANGIPVTQTETLGNRTLIRKQYVEEKAMCFDYDTIKKEYDISLESIMTDNPDE